MKLHRGAAGAIVLALVSASALAPNSTSAGQTVSIRDLTRITRFSGPQFSPDGKSIAVIEMRPDLESDKYRSELVLVDVAHKTMRALTHDRHAVDSPRWSPDGERIAFIAPDVNKKGQIFIFPMNGGDAVQITKFKEDVQQFAWSPDGKSIAFAATDPKPELKGEDKYRTAFKVGDDDFTTDEAVRPTHLWLVPADGGDAKRLTGGTWSLPSSLPPGSPPSPVKWSKDGKSIVIVRQETPSTGDQLQTRVEVLDVASGSIRNLTGATTLEGYPEVSPDGKTIAYWRNRDAQPYQFQDVWLAPFAGGAGRDISLKLDRNVFLTAWMPDGKSLIVGGNTNTTVGLWRLGTDGSVAAINLGGIVPNNGYWIDADVSHNGTAIAVTAQTATDPNELYLVPVNGGAPVALTHENAGLSNLSLARQETIVWKGPQGRMIDGVVTYPKDYQPGARYPMVLFIHGGPNSASRQRFGLMEQVLASHGWLVFEPNYRGSDNMGNAFYASIFKDAGQGPGEDVMAGVAFLKSKGLVDPSRMAVTGWSYGGYMTTWIAAHYPVWKAAVAGASVTDWVDMYDLSDGNTAVGLQQVGPASPYVGNAMATYRAESPASTETKITAPTLVMSDTGDFRVPMTQSFGLYRALKDNHVTTEFYLYPVHGHFPGDPIRQMDVYQRWVDWLVKYLK
ncbi:MAG: S9 family peptidase [Rhizomicrobium sp.]|jgi:dipeptidyl aminopeptidase/acylaminoacyl peptidase